MYVHIYALNVLLTSANIQYIAYSKNFASLSINMHNSNLSCAKSSSQATRELGDIGLYNELFK